VKITEYMSDFNEMYRKNVSGYEEERDD